MAENDLAVISLRIAGDRPSQFLEPVQHDGDVRDGLLRCRRLDHEKSTVRGHVVPCNSSVGDLVVALEHQMRGSRRRCSNRSRSRPPSSCRHCGRKALARRVTRSARIHPSVEIGNWPPGVGYGAHVDLVAAGYVRHVRQPAAVWREPGRPLIESRLENSLRPPSIVEPHHPHVSACLCRDLVEKEAHPSRDTVDGACSASEESSDALRYRCHRQRARRSFDSRPSLHDKRDDDRRASRPAPDCFPGDGRIVSVETREVIDPDVLCRSLNADRHRIPIRGDGRIRCTRATRRVERLNGPTGPDPHHPAIGCPGSDRNIGKSSIIRHRDLRALAGVRLLACSIDERDGWACDLHLREVEGDDE